MSRRLALTLAIGALAYAATLLATLPATLLSRTVESATQERLALRAPHGTAWSGSARLYGRRRSGELTDLGPVRWRVRPASVLTGRLAAEVALGEAAQPAGVVLSPSSLTLRRLDVRLPAALLASLDPALETLGPQGTLRARSEELRIDADSILGLAELEWQQARVARAPGLDFGSHVARLRGGGDKVVVELATLSGPLSVEGGGTWERRGRFSFAASAQSGSPEMAAFLKSVCAEYRDSRCTFRYAR